MFEAALRFEGACRQAGVACFLGGSGASTLQGEPRLTNDLDFVIDARADQIPTLISALGEDFEVDPEALVHAARRRASWNIYYLPDFMKIDVFFLRASPFDRSEFERRRPVLIEGDGRFITVKSPEDSVLRKLLWYRQEGEVSARQLRDVAGILAVNAGRLDEAYMDHWASTLQIEDLLASVRARLP